MHSVFSPSFLRRLEAEVPLTGSGASGRSAFEWGARMDLSGGEDPFGGFTLPVESVEFSEEDSVANNAS